VGGWDLYFYPDFSISSHRIPYVFAGNLLILVKVIPNQSKVLRMISSAESPGINQGRVQAFLPPLGLTKPGCRMPPCEESPGIDKSGNGSGWMGG
jgi:hypothetical protein